MPFAIGGSIQAITLEGQSLLFPVRGEAQSAESEIGVLGEAAARQSLLELLMAKFGPVKSVYSFDTTRGSRGCLRSVNSCSL